MAPLSLVQLTDSHILDRPGARIMGRDTLATLRRTLKAVKRALGSPDLVLATGARRGAPRATPAWPQCSRSSARPRPRASSVPGARTPR